MSEDGYEVFEDPYCYKGTFVLKNRAGLRDAVRLQAFELEMSSLRAEEPLPAGRFGPAHYRAIHRHLFGDVYSWAGRYRTVRTAKGRHVFCYPENIDGQMTMLFERLRSKAFTALDCDAAFIKAAAKFLGDLTRSMRSGRATAAPNSPSCTCCQRSSATQWTLRAYARKRFWMR